MNQTFKRPTAAEKAAAAKAQRPLETSPGLERDNREFDQPHHGHDAPLPSKPARAHKATYATDKRKGGYLVRVEGPSAEAFVGREVPVTTRNGTEHLEKLQRLIWTGTDQETGKPVSLYAFESRPKVRDEIAF